MSLKDTVKSIKCMEGAVRFVKSLTIYRRWKLKQQSRYDMKRLYKYAGCFHQETKGAVQRDLMMQVHSLERSFTMPEFECGHGGGNMKRLIALVNQYAAEGCSMDDFEPGYALSIIATYLAIHEREGYPVPEDVLQPARALLSKFPAQPVFQPKVTQEEFWGKNEAPFPEFAASRHCVREYAGKAPLESIYAAIDLACTAPSACNRQYTKVHIYDSREQVRQIFGIQVGNQGFGHLVEQVLIVTTNLSALNCQEERFDAFTNAGIFTMNLCYALHYHKVAFCILNWSATPAMDMEMHRVAGIPDEESIALVLSVGMPPQEFSHAKSCKKSSREVAVYHKR